MEMGERRRKGREEKRERARDRLKKWRRARVGKEEEERK
jgi:hypothetical protein